MPGSASAGDGGASTAPAASASDVRGARPSAGSPVASFGPEPPLPSLPTFAPLPPLLDASAVGCGRSPVRSNRSSSMRSSSSWKSPRTSSRSGPLTSLRRRSMVRSRSRRRSCSASIQAASSSSSRSRSSSVAVPSSAAWASSRASCRSSGGRRVVVVEVIAVSPVRPGPRGSGHVGGGPRAGGHQWRLAGGAGRRRPHGPSPRDRSGASSSCSPPSGSTSTRSDRVRFAPTPWGTVRHRRASDRGSGGRSPSSCGDGAARWGTHPRASEHSLPRRPPRTPPPPPPSAHRLVSPPCGGAIRS